MEYQLIIKVPFEALDDIEAREIAHRFSDHPDTFLLRDDVDKKVQRVYKDRPPEKINI